MKGLFLKEDIIFLKHLTEELMNLSRVKPGEDTSKGKNITGKTILTPGGRPGYPAFWTRDPAWLVDTGMINADEVWDWIELMCLTVQGPEGRVLKSGSFIRPYSIPDHINFDGRPVFFPGGYSSGEDQGGRWGKYPPIDDNFFLPFSVYEHVKLTKNPENFTRYVTTSFGKIRLCDLCEHVVNTIPVDEKTGLCFGGNDIDEHVVDWGYCDGETKTGLFLFPSIEKWQASNYLAEIFEKTGEKNRAEYWRGTALKIKQSILPIFYRKEDSKHGWLISATKIGNKADVWGSAYAVYSGVIDGESAFNICNSLLDAYQKRTAVRYGQVRHILTTEGYWEISCAPKGFYQNGAYWAYPVGWYIYTLSLIDKYAARDLFSEYIGFLREHHNDKEIGAWECVCYPEPDYIPEDPFYQPYQNESYLTSAAMPYANLRKRGLI